MPHNYDPALPTDRDTVRFRCGDVNGLPQWFVADETIDALLAKSKDGDGGKPDVNDVAAQCAESIGSQCIQLADKVAQRNLRIEYSNRANQAFALADRLRNKSKNQLDTGAALAPMQAPNLQNYLIELPCGDPNDPRLKPPGVP